MLGAVVGILVFLIVLALAAGFSFLLGWASTALCRWPPAGVMLFVAGWFCLPVLGAQRWRSEVGEWGANTLLETLGLLLAIAAAIGCVVGLSVLFRWSAWGALVGAVGAGLVAAGLPVPATAHSVLIICVASLAMTVVLERRCSVRSLIITQGLGSALVLARSPADALSFALGSLPFVALAIVLGKILGRLR